MAAPSPTSRGQMQHLRAPNASASPTPSPLPSPSPSPATAASATSAANPAAATFDAIMKRLEAAFPSPIAGGGAGGNGSSSGSSSGGGAADLLKKAAGVVSGNSSSSSSKASTVPAPRVDDATVADALFELDRFLSSSSAVDRGVLAKSQGSLEKMFLDLVIPRADQSVLRLAMASSLTHLLEHAVHNVAGWYNDLIKMVQDSKDTTTRLAALQCCVSLSRRFGPQFLLSLPEYLTVLSKSLRARDDLALRELLVDALAAAYVGTGGSPRVSGIAADHTHMDMLKLLGKFLPAGGDARLAPPSLKKRVAHALVAIVYHSIDGREVDAVISLLLKALTASTSLAGQGGGGSSSSGGSATNDAGESEVRFALAEAIGDVLALSVRKDWGAIAAEAAKRAAAAAPPGPRDAASSTPSSMEEAAPAVIAMQDDSSAARAVRFKQRGGAQPRVGTVPATQSAQQHIRVAFLIVAGASAAARWSSNSSTAVVYTCSRSHGSMFAATAK